MRQGATAKDGEIGGGVMEAAGPGLVRTLDFHLSVMTESLQRVMQ